MVVVSLNTHCLGECGDLGKFWEVFGNWLGGVISTCSDPRYEYDFITQSDPKEDVTHKGVLRRCGLLDKAPPSTFKEDYRGQFGDDEIGRIYDATEEEETSTVAQDRQLVLVEKIKSKRNHGAVTCMAFGLEHHVEK